MKRSISALLLIIFTVVLSTAAAQELPITGAVIDKDSLAVSYATVILSLDDRQVAGSATNDKGEFSLSVEAGEYQLTVSYLGYENYTAQVKSGESLGFITLEPLSTQIDDVVVTSNFIRREADRFVVDVANSPSAIGQDGEELLKGSPGVWISDDKISINGDSGSKVYVNDRELKMSDEQIMIYLRNLKSDDVRRIEVIPQSGADFDASSSAGVIMIYLKRQVESGVMGNVSLRGSYGRYIANFSPSINVNYQSKKLTLNSSVWFNYNDNQSDLEAVSTYSDAVTLLGVESQADNVSQSVGGRVEAIYQLNDRHSVGAEVTIFSRDNLGQTLSNSTLSGSGITSVGQSSYDSESGSENISATFNYIFKLDSMGSTLKLLADYNKNSSDSFSDNATTYSSLDSLYRSSSSADFQVSTITLAAEKIISPTLSLKGGLKFTHNDMESYSNYTYLDSGSWSDLSNYNSDEIYTENIGAAYAIASSRLGRWSLVAGLRGEYTQTKGRDDLLNKRYMSWFPNLNATYLLDPTGSNSITMQYSRSISRPSFWSLDPTRQQISEYSYQVGNPALKPQYTSKLSATYVLKYKYSFSAALQRSRDGVQVIMMEDEENPNVTYLISENMESQNDLYLMTNLPFQIKPWWSLNANLIYVRRIETIDSDSDAQKQNITMANIQTTFTLPKGFNLNLGCFSMSDVYSGNIHVASQTSASASISKRLFDNKLSISAAANNLFLKDQTITSTTSGVEQVLVNKSGWLMPRYTLSLTYNFKAGKEYRARQGVESASAEDKARITKSEQ